MSAAGGAEGSEDAGAAGGSREVELKVAVPDPAALRAVAAAAERRGARAERPVVQVNRFLDAAGGRLRAGDRTLRLRSAAGRFTLTAKGPIEAGRAGRDPGPDPGGAALHVRAEDEVEVDAAVADAILAGAADPLDALERGLGRATALVRALRAALGGERPAVVGAFSNERTVVGPLAAGGTTVALELDRTTFPGGVEGCEVELELPIEAAGAGRRLLAELLAEAGVEGRPARSKAERFFEALRSAKNSAL